MPLYEDEKHTRERLYELRKKNQCAVCHGPLNVFFDCVTKRSFLACWDWLRTQHDGGIEREASRYEREGMEALNIPRRREIMTQQQGQEKALALRKYDAIATLDKKSSTDILTILFPGAEKASPAEFQKAVGLCMDYGLDPRMNDIFLIPFKVKVKDDKGNILGEKTAYETVRGIPSTRKIAARKHKWTYLDDTPRYMTDEEEVRYFKTVDPDKVRRIVKLKDMETGATAPGYSEWVKYRTWVNPKTGEIKQYPVNPKGVDKGNTMEHMADIRAERQALDRLYPADMPSSRIRVVDTAVEGEYTVIQDTGTTGEIEEIGEEPELSVTEGEEKTGPEPSAALTDKAMMASAAKKLGWDDKRLLKEIQERFHLEITSTASIDHLPTVQLHEIASKLVDLADVS
jgi:hypothetical protein